MQFVALDLETTGLNPKKDTIIEIAAIKFSLEKKEKTFEIIHFEEKTMLINPECGLEPEVTLITGITPQMLADKKTWREVEKNVANFIGDAPIVGHNILFDKAVLENHNIDLENHIFLDTFELASILSMDAKSLNLWFLAEYYGIQKRGEEHRALTDTWLSVDLFHLFLGKIAQFWDEEKALWHTAMKCGDDATMRKIAEIAGISADEGSWEKYLWQESASMLNTRETEKEESTEKNLGEAENIYQILPPHRADLVEFFKKNTDTKQKIQVVVRNKDDGKNLEKILTEKGIDAGIFEEKNTYLSSAALAESIQKWEKMERKSMILIARLLFWKKEKWYCLEDFKSYGIERKLLPAFKMRDDETCREYEEKQVKNKKNTFEILPAFSFAKRKNDEKSIIIYKDASLLEGLLRQAFSKNVSFYFLYEALESIQHPIAQKIAETLSVIEDMYFQVAERPTGDNPFPPGNFGETYVISQEYLWKKMGRSIALWGNRLAEEAAEFEEKFKPKGRKETYLKIDILRSIWDIQEFHHKKEREKSMILTIREKATSVRYISNTFQNSLPKNKSIYLEFWRESEKSTRFIENNFSKYTLQKSEESTKILCEANHKKIRAKKTVILTTSLRHIQEIWAEIEDFFDGKILLQGVAGGKAKMLHNYQKEDRCVLVGLIEAWRDMADIWKHTDEVFIAKVPFDPPTDPYFLVKAKSLSNNFEEYSLPMCIAKINTLVGNIVCQNPEIQIFYSDKRLRQSKWGKTVREALL